MKPKIKAKVDEFLKTHGTRELNIDEMGKVSGGQQNCPIYGVLHSHDEIDEFCGIVEEVDKEFGRDAAIDFALGILPIPGIEEAMRAKGAQGLGGVLHKRLDADLDTLAGRYSY